MEKFTLTKLWELRGELDNAILRKDYDEIKLIKVKYENLVDRAFLFNRAFICYNYSFQTISDRQMHNSQNVISILKNIENYEKKFLDGENVSTKLKTPKKSPFLAGEIWVIRAMYDRFLYQSKVCKAEWEIQQNMILGNAIKVKLSHLMKCEETEDYYNELKAFLYEVNVGYESKYGNNQPRIDFNSLSDEYLDK